VRQRASTYKINTYKIHHKAGVRKGAHKNPKKARKQSTIKLINYRLTLPKS
jgi:hypothetical protein